MASLRSSEHREQSGKAQDRLSVSPQAYSFFNGFLSIHLESCSAPFARLSELKTAPDNGLAQSSTAQERPRGLALYLFLGAKADAIS